MLLMEHKLEFEFYMFIYLAVSLDHMYIKRTWLLQPQKRKDKNRFCNEEKKLDKINMYGLLFSRLLCHGLYLMIGTIYFSNNSSKLFCIVRNL